MIRNGRFGSPWRVRDRWITDLTARGVHQRWILFAGLLQGMGQGLCSPSLHAAVAGSVPQESLGIATAANRLVNHVGMAFGIALLTGIYGPSGYQPAFIAGGAMALLAVLAAAVMKRDKRR